MSAVRQGGVGLWLRAMRDVHSCAPGEDDMVIDPKLVRSQMALMWTTLK